MRSFSGTAIRRATVVIAGILIAKVTFATALGYVDYFPPNFGSDFLRGRQSYFFGVYQWVFYTHIASGPVALLTAIVLLSERFRARLPAWHRCLGRCQVVNVLGLVVPSGLHMAYYASSGTIAAAGFATLSIVTAACVVLGWRAAVKRRFAMHQRWMWRCFALLSSAVVIRVLGGLGTVAGVNALWFDPMISWASWLMPLAAFELSSLKTRRPIYSAEAAPKGA